VKAAWVLLALTAALALQTTVARFTIGAGTPFDLVLVAVVYVGLTWGSMAGLLAGTAGGLAQDALSGGIIGVGGLAKSVVGFFVGAVGSQFILAEPLPRFVVFFAATAVHAACFLGLYALIDVRDGAAPFFGAPAGAVATQALGNGIIGVLTFQVAESLPGVVQRRRESRYHVGRRRG
jgi:rod shape-determining protein MreD